MKNMKDENPAENRGIKKQLDDFNNKFGGKNFFYFRSIILVVAARLITLNGYMYDRKENYSIGRPSEKTYFALSSTRYEDRAATLELRQRAAARIVDVMVQDEKIAAEVSRRLGILESGGLKELFNAPLLEIFNKQNAAAQKTIIDTALQIGRKTVDESEDRERQTSLIWKYLKETNLPQSQRNIVFQMLDVILNPSLQSDGELVSKLRDDVAAQIPSVVKEIRAGAVLVQKGQLVTPALARLLASQGYPDAAFPWKHLIFVLVVIFLWSFWPIWVSGRMKEKLDEREWLYIAVILSFVWVLEVFFNRIGGYSMAVIGLAGWISLTIPPSLSYHIIFGGGVISVMIAFGSNPAFVCLGSILSAVAAAGGNFMFINAPAHRYTIWRNIFILGLSLGAASVCLHWGLGLYFNYNILLSAVVYSAVWSTLVLAIMPIWERLFDILSHMRLLELSHSSQPLMKRLQMEAPGTYSHVQIVAELAGTAAERLNMNALLVRAGALYHDVGKLKNPQFFTENQFGGENITEKMLPTYASRILISHVKDGLEIAKESIPRSLHRFIAEHHGDTVQWHFFDKAKDLGMDVTEKDFKYSGPKPQSRETALLMFADSVEAASRSHKGGFADDEELKKFIKKILAKKINEEQFDEANITMRELNIIISVFVKVLNSTFHSRNVKDVENVMKEAKLKNGKAEAADSPKPLPETLSENEVKEEK